MSNKRNIRVNNEENNFKPLSYSFRILCFFVCIYCVNIKVNNTCVRRITARLRYFHNNIIISTHRVKLIKCCSSIERVTQETLRGESFSLRFYYVYLIEYKIIIHSRPNVEN